MAKLAPTVKLNNGLDMPIFGLGTYQSLNNEGEAAIQHAIDIGYRHIDTAYFYGNEVEVGKAVRAKIDKGTVKREDLFIVTKLWTCFHDPSLVETAFRKSLENLNLDYIDLYLMHWPMGFEFRGWDKPADLLPKDKDGNLCYSNWDYVDTWKAMEKLMDTGLVRSLGVSNFNSHQITRLLEYAKVKPVTNQVECTINLQQKKLTEFCKDLGITVTSYSPIKNKDVLEDEKIKSIGAKYGKSSAQVIMNYLVKELGVITIPKSTNLKRIEENFDIFDFKLGTEDIKTLAKFDNGHRTNPLNLCLKHKYYPFYEEF